MLRKLFGREGPNDSGNQAGPAAIPELSSGFPLKYNFPQALGIYIGETQVRIGTYTGHNGFTLLKELPADILFTDTDILAGTNKSHENRYRLIPLIKSTSKCCNSVRLKNRLNSTQMIFPLSNEEVIATYFKWAFSLLPGIVPESLDNVVVTLPFMPTRSEKERIQQSLRIVGVPQTRTYGALTSIATLFVHKFKGRTFNSESVLVVHSLRQSFSMATIEIEQEALTVTNYVDGGNPQLVRFVGEPEFIRNHPKMFQENSGKIPPKYVKIISKAYKVAALTAVSGGKKKPDRVILFSDVKATSELDQILNDIFGSNVLSLDLDAPLKGSCVLATRSFAPKLIEFTCFDLSLTWDGQNFELSLSDEEKLSSNVTVFQETVTVLPQGSSLVLEERLKGQEIVSLVGQYRVTALSPTLEPCEARLTCNLSTDGTCSFTAAFAEGSYGSMTRLDNWLVGLTCDTLAMVNILKYYEVKDKLKIDMKEESPALVNPSDAALAKGVQESLNKYEKLMSPLGQYNFRWGKLLDLHREHSSTIINEFILSNRQNIIAGRAAVNHHSEKLVAKMDHKFKKLVKILKTSKKTPNAHKEEKVSQLTPEKVPQFDQELIPVIESRMEVGVKEALQLHKSFMHSVTDSKQPHTDQQLKSYHRDTLQEILAAFRATYSPLTSPSASNPTLSRLIQATELKIQKQINSQLETYLKRYELSIEQMSRKIKTWAVEAESFYEDEMDSSDLPQMSHEDAQEKHQDLAQKILTSFKENFAQSKYIWHDCWGIELEVKLREKLDETLEICQPLTPLKNFDKYFVPLGSPDLLKTVQQRIPGTTGEAFFSLLEKNRLVQSSEASSFSSEAASENDAEVASILKDCKPKQITGEKLETVGTSAGSTVDLDDQEVKLQTTAETSTEFSTESTVFASISSEIQQIVNQNFENIVKQCLTHHRDLMYKITDSKSAYTSSQIQKLHDEVLADVLAAFTLTYEDLYSTGIEDIVIETEERIIHEIDSQLGTYLQRYEAAIQKVLRTLKDCTLEGENQYDEAMTEFELQKRTRREVREKHGEVAEEVRAAFIDNLQEQGLTWESFMSIELEVKLREKLEDSLEKARPDPAVEIQEVTTDEETSGTGTPTDSAEATEDEESPLVEEEVDCENDPTEDGSIPPREGSPQNYGNQEDGLGEGAWEERDPNSIPTIEIEPFPSPEDSQDEELQYVNDLSAKALKEDATADVFDSHTVYKFTDEELLHLSRHYLEPILESPEEDNDLEEDSENEKLDSFTHHEEYLSNNMTGSSFDDTSGLLLDCPEVSVDSDPEDSETTTSGCLEEKPSGGESDNKSSSHEAGDGSPQSLSSLPLEASSMEQTVFVTAATEIVPQEISSNRQVTPAVEISHYEKLANRQEPPVAEISHQEILANRQVMPVAEIRHQEILAKQQEPTAAEISKQEILANHQVVSVPEDVPTIKCVDTAPSDPNNEDIGLERDQIEAPTLPRTENQPKNTSEVVLDFGTGEPTPGHNAKKANVCYKDTTTVDERSEVTTKPQIQANGSVLKEEEDIRLPKLGTSCPVPETKHSALSNASASNDTQETLTPTVVEGPFSTKQSSGTETSEEVPEAIPSTCRPGNNTSIPNGNSSNHLASETPNGDVTKQRPRESHQNCKNKNNLNAFSESNTLQNGLQSRSAVTEVLSAIANDSCITNIYSTLDQGNCTTALVAPPSDGNSADKESSPENQSVLKSRSVQTEIDQALQDCAKVIIELEEHEDIEEVVTEITTRTTKTYPPVTTASPAASERKNAASIPTVNGNSAFTPTNKEALQSHSSNPSPDGPPSLLRPSKKFQGTLLFSNTLIIKHL